MMKCISLYVYVYDGPVIILILVDVNKSTFHKHMREKLFLHFRSQSPWPLTVRPLICSTSYSCPALCFNKIN